MADIPNPIITDGGLQEAMPGTIGSAIPQAYLPNVNVNYAEDPETQRLIDQEIVPIMNQSRQDKMPLHNEWQEVRNMEMLKHDHNKKYNGRSDAYVPVFNRNSATLVSNLSKGLFPSDDYFDVTTLSGQDLDKAKTVKTYLQWEFEKVGQVRRYLKPYLKSLVNYGNAPLKYVYRKKTGYEGRLGKTTPDSVLQAMFRPESRVDGLQISARSPFNVYVFPFTAESLDEATMIFEDINVSLAFIEEKLRLKQWARPDVARNAPRPAEQDWAEQELMASRDLAQQQPMGGAKGLGTIRSITECWTYLKLPRAAYLPDEDPDCMLPVLIIFAGTEPIFVGRNPFWHQRPPYLYSRLNIESGLFYGYGFGRVIKGLQALTNDFANQMNDVGVIGLNPYTLVNTAFLAGPLRPLKPGAVIETTNINEAVKWDRPPVEILQYGVQAMSVWSGMAQDFGGAPPILQGQAAGKTGRTATGAQLLQKNAMGPLQDIVEDIELDTMIPLLKGTWINAQQYRSDEIMINVAGQSVRVDPATLAIDAEFRWLASSQAVNQQMRAQQAISLLQVVMPLMQPLMAMGYTVDPAVLLKKIYSDGFGFRGFDEFCHKMDPMQMAQMAMQSGAAQPAGNPGAPQAEQGDRVRSFLEQANGGGTGEMVPGEFEEGGAVRQGADDMAAMLGGGGGFG